MRRALLPLCLALASCGEAVPIGNTADSPVSATEPLTPGPVPVRIGELGPSLEACTAAGTTRGLKGEESLTVRAAPFEVGAEIGAVRAGGRFFVCSRSHDQKWLGIVYDEGFTLSPACGVSERVPARKAYSGPCSSGWVASPFVKLIAGEESLPPPNQAVPEANASAGASV